MADVPLHPALNDGITRGIAGESDCCEVAVIGVDLRRAVQTLLQRQIDAAHAELVEAAKQRKILEKLRDRQKSRWAADRTRRELAELDDLTMRRAAWEQLVRQSSSSDLSNSQQLSDYRTPLNSADNHMERSS